MALEHTKLDVINETPKKRQEIDKETLDFVFGKSDSRETNPGGMELINNEKNHSNHNNNKETDNSSFPLLEPERDKQKPPLAGPEVVDLNGDTPANGTPYLGIDDGLLDTHDDKPHILDVGDELDDDKTEPEMREDGVGTEDDGKWPWMGGDEPDYPYDINLQPRFGADDRPISPIPSTIDVNTYQQKKNLAQGMMDLALLSANANQLRYVLESASGHPYYYSSLVFISLSIIFQIAVGVGLIMNSRYDVNDKKEICKADKINNFTVLGIFLITIVNVFITSFSVATPTVTVTVGGPVIQQAG